MHLYYVPAADRLGKCFWPSSLTGRSTVPQQWGEVGEDEGEDKGCGQRKVRSLPVPGTKPPQSHYQIATRFGKTEDRHRW